MNKYYRFQNDEPKLNDHVHCYTDFANFKGFVDMMRQQDPLFGRMKFWEITGVYIKPDDGDIVIRVQTVKEIRM